MPATAPSAATFDGFYLRNSLACDGKVPSAGSYCLCPDIIASATPIEDAGSMLSSQQSWNTTYDVQPTPGERCYLYVRGLDGSATAFEGSLGLCWAPAQLIMFPQAWRSNELPAADGTAAVKVSAASGHIGVGEEPFEWARPPLLPDPGEYLAFVAYASRSSASQPPPAVDSWAQMSELLTQRLDLGFRNSAAVDRNADGWYRRIRVQVPSCLPTAQIALTLTTVGFVGNTIGLIGDLFASDRTPMMLRPASIVQDGAATAITVSLSGGETIDFAVQYWKTGAAPEHGSTARLTADYAVPDHELEQAGSRGLVSPSHSRMLSDALQIKPTAFLPLGAATLIAT
ncbi:MAG: hypothetical protein WAU77_10050 [Solirubrobacteraceae bacterium]